jgi:hypothetical protein
MEKKRFSLDLREPVKWTEILQLIFGICCFVITIITLISLSRSAEAERSSLTGIVFLFVFGIYQVWAGLGYARKFIEFAGTEIILKLNSVGGVKHYISSDIKKIELYPLNTVLHLNSGSKINLRFGINTPERNEKIADEIIAFAEANNISFELKD